MRVSGPSAPHVYGGLQARAMIIMISHEITNVSKCEQRSLRDRRNQGYLQMYPACQKELDDSITTNDTFLAYHECIQDWS